MAYYIPKRGDVVCIDFDQFSKSEQANPKLALVLSPYEFNKQIKLVLVAPITFQAKGFGFEVEIEIQKTKGAVLCQQVRTIDYIIRKVKLIEQAPANVLAESLAKVRVLVD